MVRSFTPTLREQTPHRTKRRLAADAAFREVNDFTVGNFTYALLRPGGVPQTCEQFIEEDSSLTVLELMGPIPDANDTRDSDVVLVSRMFQYPGMPAAKVIPPGHW